LSADFGKRAEIIEEQMKIQA